MSFLHIPSALQQAVHHLQNAQWPQAEHLLRQVLQIQPQNPDALHFLGVLAHQVGKPEAAVELISQAIALQPHNAIPYCNLAESLRLLGRYEEGVAACQKAIALDPKFAAAYLNLGTLFSALKQYDQAIANLQQAIALNPNDPKPYNNLGIALQDTKRFDEAIAAYQRCLQLQPQNPEALSNLGTALQEKECLPQALQCYQQALSLEPHNPQALSNLADVLVRIKRFDDAIAAARQALSVNPASVEAATNLGNALQNANQHDEAIAVLNQVIAQHPRHTEAHNNLGNAYHRLGQLDFAIASYRTALECNPTALNIRNNLGLAQYKNGQFDDAIATFNTILHAEPNNAEAHFHLALVLLHCGRLSEGWTHYEHRWNCAEYKKYQRPAAQPLWRGDNLDGKTILLHSEQGFGDAIQFIRYAPLIASWHNGHAQVLLECQSELVPLFQNVPGITQTFPRETPADTLPPIDYQCPLLSLPPACKTDLTTIPNTIPYLHVDPVRRARFSEHIKTASQSPNTLRVGLVWAGRPQHAEDRFRSLTLAHLAPLAQVPNVTFFSLQKGPAADQLSAAPFPLIDLAPLLNDFADSAAALAHLDLLITVDTAPAHLAGALGRPVWTLLHFSGEWRWLRDRTDSPWYPTMRLYRQPTLHNWTPVLSQLVRDLHHFPRPAST